MSYLLRLVCVCGAAFFLVNFAAGVLALAASPAAVRFGERMRPAAGAWVVLGLRLLPVTLALGVVAGFCVPSYLRFEQDASESIGWVCLALGIAGLLLVAGSVRCVVSTQLKSNRIAAAHESGKRPIFALVGFLRPRVIVSNRVREALSQPQMEAALLHESAHQRSHDNLKRLAMIAAPGLLPFRSSFGALESGWVRLSEWAADDFAITAQPMLAIALAEALVRVARVANISDEFPALSAFVGCQGDLGERVERLLTERRQEASGRRWLTGALGVAIAAVSVATGVMATTHCDLLYGVHCAMEHLVH